MSYREKRAAAKAAKEARLEQKRVENARRAEAKDLGMVVDKEVNLGFALVVLLWNYPYPFWWLADTEWVCIVILETCLIAYIICWLANTLCLQIICTHFAVSSHRLIPQTKQIFELFVGYSDHTLCHPKKSAKKSVWAEVWRTEGIRSSIRKELATHCKCRRSKSWRSSRIDVVGWASIHVCSGKVLTYNRWC